MARLDQVADSSRGGTLVLNCQLAGGQKALHRDPQRLLDAALTLGVFGEDLGCKIKAARRAHTSSLVSESPKELEEYALRLHTCGQAIEHCGVGVGDEHAVAPRHGNLGAHTPVVRFLRRQQATVWIRLVSLLHDPFEVEPGAHAIAPGGRAGCSRARTEAGKRRMPEQHDRALLPDREPPQNTDELPDLRAVVLVGGIDVPQGCPE